VPKVPPHPGSSSEAASAVGRANTKVDTSPEVRLRSLLHRRGRRFHKNKRIMALGSSAAIRADIVFARKKVAVFVDGCFWHCCPEHGTDPTTNSSYWCAKLSSNVERDARQTTALREAGWTVVRVWEHESPENAVRLVEEALSADE
jgi:DNA mismatch endonuclease (patch repair protein)